MGVTRVDNKKVITKVITNTIKDKNKNTTKDKDKLERQVIRDALVSVYQR